MMNSTMKVVRGKVTEHYNESLEFLYDFNKLELGEKNNINAINSAGKVFISK